jgi:hypothetical protein
MAVLTKISRIAPHIRLGHLLGILTDMTEHPYTVSPTRSSNPCPSRMGR